MIVTVLFAVFIYVYAKPVEHEADIEKSQDLRLSLLPLDFKASKTNETSIEESLPKYFFIPEIKEMLYEENYTIHIIFPKFVEPLTADFYTIHLPNKLGFLVLNGYTDNGVIRFSYKKMLPEYVKSKDEWSYDNKTEITLKIPVSAHAPPFSKTLLRSRTEINGYKYQISTLLPGLSKDDIHLESNNEYLYIKALKDYFMSYEEIRVWPPCADKEYQWEYSEDSLSVWLTLNAPCV